MNNKSVTDELLQWSNFYGCINEFIQHSGVESNTNKVNA